MTLSDPAGPCDRRSTRARLAGDARCTARVRRSGALPETFQRGRPVALLASVISSPHGDTHTELLARRPVAACPRPRARMNEVERLEKGSEIDGEKLYAQVDKAVDPEGMMPLP